jgi:hypothetical protein
MMKKKTSITGGIILILLGLLFLGRTIFPDYFQFWEWPFVIIGLGIVFLIWALVSGTGGLAVPAAILGGIGGILYYQNLTGNWESWAYVWALIPGFVGIGIVISGIINRDFRESLTSGLVLIMISAIIFFAFAEGFGLAPDITKYWPVLLIGLGIIALVRAILPGKKKRS